MIKYLVVSLYFLICITGCHSAINKYDTLVEKDETCNQYWADYEATLQRRADLIPNLVNIVKGYAAQESKVLKEVIEARASATQIKLSAEDLTDPRKVKAFEEAQANLKGSLSRLMLVQESYPELKSSQQFQDLMVQIEGSENRILRARQKYNESVKDFNLELRRVSGKVINPVTGNEFKPRAYFQANASTATAPSVSFQ